jgi:bacterioferritin-associated ferredoxin
MYVCLCRGITDRQIRGAVDQGACTLSQVRGMLSVADCCGRCLPMTRQIIREQIQAAQEACAQALPAPA